MSESLRAELDDFDPVLRHAGGAAAPLARWRALTGSSWRAGWPRVKALAPDVMAVVADPRTLYAAAHALRAGGPKATAAGGARLDALTAAELWAMARALGKALAADRYRPGREEIVRVRKATGTGRRPVVLMTGEDRTVHKAVALVLGPVLDPLFAADSYAFRPGRNRVGKGSDSAT